MQNNKNYHRFWGLLRQLCGDAEQIKVEVVRKASAGRTMSLRELSEREYAQAVWELERLVGAQHPWDNPWREPLRARRSAALHLMQLWGVRTASWDDVDRFCLDPRIAGRRFRHLKADDLDALCAKLRAMLRKRDEERRQREEEGPTPIIPLH